MPPLPSADGWGPAFREFGMDGRMRSRSGSGAYRAIGQERSRAHEAVDAVDVDEHDHSSRWRTWRRLNWADFSACPPGHLLALETGRDGPNTEPTEYPWALVDRKGFECPTPETPSMVTDLEATGRNWIGPLSGGAHRLDQHPTADSPPVDYCYGVQEGHEGSDARDR